MDRVGFISSLHYCRRGVLVLRRRMTAVVMSLALHGLLMAALLMSISSTVSGDSIGTTNSGSGTGNELGVELVATQSATPDVLKVKRPNPTEVADTSDITPPPVATPAIPVAALTVSDMQPITQISDLDQSTPTDSTVDTGERGGGTSGSNNTLWKQIEPCWRRLATKNTHAATLQVSFSPLGNISRIADAAVASDSGSEAQAIQALSECGPYVSASSQKDVRIAFPAP